MDDAAQCGRIVEEFLAAPGPGILEAAVDPFEPPLPGKVTAEQATKFARSLLRGEPNRDKIVWTVFRPSAFRPVTGSRSWKTSKAASGPDG